MFRNGRWMHAYTRNGFLFWLIVNWTLGNFHVGRDFSFSEIPMVVYFSQLHTQRSGQKLTANRATICDLILFLALIQESGCIKQVIKLVTLYQYVISGQSKRKVMRFRRLAPIYHWVGYSNYVESQTYCTPSVEFQSVYATFRDE